MILGDPYRPTQLDPTRPNPKLAKNLDPTQLDPWMDPTRVQFCYEKSHTKLQIVHLSVQNHFTRPYFVRTRFGS